MDLQSIIPFGRSFDEYARMFALSGRDGRRRILGVGDGPASFNAEATRKDWKVVSIDPIYRFPAAEIEARFHGSLGAVIDQVIATPGDWTWSYHGSPAALREHRTRVIADFVADLSAGRRAGRYVTASLPRLPFACDSFDLALCSHLLFLYSDLLGLELHLEAIAEMLRVAPEARVFPLLSLDSRKSRHLEGVMTGLERAGHAVEVRGVDYELQKGGNQVLIARRAG